MSKLLNSSSRRLQILLNLENRALFLNFTKKETKKKHYSMKRFTLNESNIYFIITYLYIKISYPVVVANLMLSDVVVRPSEMKKNPLN